MSDFLATMAKSSAERAAAAGPFPAARLGRPVASLQLGAFDVIAEIKERSPAEGALALAASVFFLFYQFWGFLATWLQVSILVAAPFAACPSSRPRTVS